MRVKSPRRQRHNKVLDLAKGYRMTKNRLYKVAREAVVHAGQYAFAGRHIRRRDLRLLWITRMNATLKNLGIRYSDFIPALKKNSIQLDRKILSELATNNHAAFVAVVRKAGFTVK